MCPARETGRPFRRRAKDTQADTTDEPHVHHPPMAETRRPEIHPYGRRRHQMSPGARVRQKRHH